MCLALRGDVPGADARARPLQPGREGHLGARLSVGDAARGRADRRRAAPNAGARAEFAESHVRDAWRRSSTTIEEFARRHRANAAARREPGCGDDDVPNGDGHRRARRPAGDPRADTRAAHAGEARSRRSTSRTPFPVRGCVELPGPDYLITLLGDDELVRGDRALRRRRCADAAPSRTRVLATVLFTDIVGSTETAAELGDRALGASCVERHHAVVRRELDALPRRRARHGRRRLLRDASTGRRARSAAPRRSRAAVRELGLEVRAGLHTGECELVDGKVAGIAVSHRRARRVAGAAGRGARLADGEGSRRGLGPRVRGSRRRRAEGRSRRVAALRGRRRRGLKLGPELVQQVEERGRRARRLARVPSPHGDDRAALRPAVREPDEAQASARAPRRRRRRAAGTRRRARARPSSSPSRRCRAP